MKKPIYETPATEYISLTFQSGEVICGSYGASIESFSADDQDFDMFGNY